VNQNLRPARVAAIVVNFRTPDFTVACVDSLVASTEPLHVIVVDNASGDGSAEEFATRYASDSRVTVVPRDVNDGYTGGNNAGGIGINMIWIEQAAGCTITRCETDGGENGLMLSGINCTVTDNYIHGTNATETLGEAASHGCLRMDPDDAAEVGLLVMENSGVIRDWDWVKNILGLGEERAVSLDRSAPLTIR